MIRIHRSAEAVRPVPGRTQLHAGAARVALAVAALSAPSAVYAKDAGAPPVQAQAQAVVVGQSDDVKNAQGNDIVVTGHASKKAEIEATGTTSVLSSADLQRQPNISVVDAMARLPGISVAPTDFFGTPSSGNHGGLDGAARGGASFVYLRGLSGSYNVNLVNGANAAQGMPYSRQIQLDLLPPVGIAAVVVNKTSTADMDGDAIGGTIDFRTPSAFDFDKKTHVGLYVQGGLSQYALDYHTPAGTGMAQAEVSHRFGDSEQFGVYASGYYGKRNFASTMVDFQAGQWEFAVSQGEQGSNPDGFAKKDNLLLTSTNAQFSEGNQVRYGGALGFDWHLGSTKLYARGTYAVSNIEQNIYQKSIQADGYSAAVVRPDGLYQNAESDGEYHAWFETAPAQSTLASGVIGGTTEAGRLTLGYSGFWSWAKDAAPDHAEVTYQTFQGNQLNGPFAVSYRNGYPLPLLSAAQLARFNDNSLYGVEQDSGEFTNSRSTASKLGGRFDATYKIGSWLDAFTAGAKVVHSSRNTFSRDYSNLNFLPVGQALNASPFSRGEESSIDREYYPYTFVRGDGAALTNAARNAASAMTLSANDFNRNTLSGHENVYAGYALAKIVANALEVQPGLRYEHTDIDNVFWNSVSADGTAGSAPQEGFKSSKTHYDILLPSIHANYRSGEENVIRGAVWRSYTRPAFFQLAGGSQTTVDSDGTISVTEGNPDLKAVKSWNFDASIEHQHRGFSASIAGYYKALSDYLYDRGTSFRATQIAVDGLQSISKPVNGGSAGLYGVEIAARYQLVDLPGWESGFGISGNMTLQHSWAHLNDASTDKTQPMQGAPERLYNASLFYEKGGLSANVSYRYNGPLIAAYRFGDFGGKALNDTQRATSSVDTTVGYSFNDDLKIAGAVSNIFDNISYYRTVGPDSYQVPQIVRWGRTFTMTLTAGF
ncbi:TonB-dependent receptor [Sphingomonas sp. M1A8_2b]